MATPSMITEVLSWFAILGAIGFLGVIILGIIIGVIVFIWFLTKKKLYDITEMNRKRLELSAEMSCRRGIKNQNLFIGGAGLSYRIKGLSVLDWLDPDNRKNKAKQIIIMVQKNNILPYSLPLVDNKMMIRCDTDDIEGDICSITGDVTLKAIDLKKRGYYYVPISRWGDANAKD